MPILNQRRPKQFRDRGLFDNTVDYIIADAVSDTNGDLFVAPVNIPAGGGTPNPGTNAWAHHPGSEGTMGDVGVMGNDFVRVYLRSATTPTTPTGTWNGVTLTLTGGWVDAISSTVGTDRLWASDGLLNNTANTATFQTPQEWSGPTGPEPSNSRLRTLIEGVLNNAIANDDIQTGAQVVQAIADYLTANGYLVESRIQDLINNTLTSVIATDGLIDVHYSTDQVLWEPELASYRYIRIRGSNPNADWHVIDLGIVVEQGGTTTMLGVTFEYSIDGILWTATRQTDSNWFRIRVGLGPWSLQLPLPEGGGSGTNLTVENVNSATLDIASSTGTDATVPSATQSDAGLQSAADKTKLDSIQAGAHVNIATDLSVENQTGTTLDIASSTGTDATVPSATQSDAGLQSAADKAKLDSIQGGAHVNIDTDLSIGNQTATTLDIESSTGTDATVPSATTSDAGLQSAADKTKLDGIEANATADQTASEIKTAYESNADTNAFTDAEQTKLSGIAAGAEVNVDTDLSIANRDADSLDIASSTGTDATIPSASTSEAGLQSATDKTKLDGVATGAEVNVDTNLTIGNRTGTSLDIESSTGTDATIPSADTTEAGLLNATDKTKLDGLDTARQMPSGGTMGQVLKKDSATDYDTSWQDDTTGSGGTSLSVANRTGTTLDILSNTGADATVPSADTTEAGLQSAADKTKLDGIETNATADQTASEIKTAYESNPNTNPFDDTEQTKLAGIETGAQVNVGTDLSIGTHVGTSVEIDSSTGSNVTIPSATTSEAGVLSSTDKTKIDGLATNRQIPSGGTTGQVLKKDTNTDYDVSWQADTGGGGGATDASALTVDPTNFGRVIPNTVTNAQEAFDAIDDSVISANNVGQAIATLTLSGTITQTQNDPLGGWVLDANAPAGFSVVDSGGVTDGAVQLSQTKISDTHDGYWVRVASGTATNFVHDFSFSVGAGNNSAVGGTVGLNTLDLLIDAHAGDNDTVSIVSQTAQTPTLGQNVIITLYLKVIAPAVVARNGNTDLAIGTQTGTELEITSSTGTNATLRGATTTEAGLQSAQDKAKLDGIQSGAEVNVNTDLSIANRDVDSLDIVSSTGANVEVPSATTTVAGLQSAADKTKLDGIEAGANVNPTNAEIKTAYEANTNTNAFTDAEQTKLSGIEANATADQTAAEIKTAYESNADTNEFSDAEQTKLAGIEANATADQTAAEIKTAYESNANTNAFDDTEQAKLAGIETGAEVNVATDLTIGNRLSTSLDVESSTGTDATIPSASTTEAGLQSAADKTKLDGIASGAQVNVGTDLSVTNRDVDSLDIASSTGANVEVPSATDTVAGLQSAADKTKLDGLATNRQVPSGGAVNQVLKKNSANDYDFAWQDDDTGGMGATATDLSIANRDADSLDVASSTGTDATIPEATTTLAGLINATDKTKLDSLTANRQIPAGGADGQVLKKDSAVDYDVVWADDEQGTGGTGNTDLSIANRNTTTLDVASSTGSDATIPAATQSLAGLQSSADKTKIDAFTATRQLPSGGTTGQVLKKDTNTDYDVSWDDDAGGAGSTDLSITNRTGTTLDIASSSGNDATVPEASTTEAGLINATDKTKLDNLATNRQLPAGGTAGQVLGKNTATDYDVVWQDGATGASLADYNAATTYEAGQMAWYTQGTDFSGVIISRQDNNVGNTPALRERTAWWDILSGSDVTQIEEFYAAEERLPDATTSWRLESGTTAGIDGVIEPNPVSRWYASIADIPENRQHLTKWRVLLHVKNYGQVVSSETPTPVIDPLVVAQNRAEVETSFPVEPIDVDNFDNYAGYAFTRSINGESGVRLVDLAFFDSSNTELEADVLFRSNALGRLDLNEIGARCSRLRTANSTTGRISVRVTGVYAQIQGSLTHTPTKMAVTGTGYLEVAHSQSHTHRAWSTLSPNNEPGARMEGTVTLTEATTANTNTQGIVVVARLEPTTGSTPNLAAGDPTSYPAVFAQDAQGVRFQSIPYTYPIPSTNFDSNVDVDTLFILGYTQDHLGPNSAKWQFFGNNTVYRTATTDGQVTSPIVVTGSSADLWYIFWTDTLSTEARDNFSTQIIKEPYGDGLYGAIDQKADFRESLNTSVKSLSRGAPYTNAAVTITGNPVALTFAEPALSAWDYDTNTGIYTFTDLTGQLTFVGSQAVNGTFDFANSSGSDASITQFGLRLVKNRGMTGELFHTIFEANVSIFIPANGTTSNTFAVQSQGSVINLSPGQTLELESYVTSANPDVSVSATNVSTTTNGTQNGTPGGDAVEFEYDLSRRQWVFTDESGTEHPVFDDDGEPVGDNKAFIDGQDLIPVTFYVDSDNVINQYTPSQFTWNATNDNFDIPTDLLRDRPATVMHDLYFVIAFRTLSDTPTIHSVLPTLPYTVSSGPVADGNNVGQEIASLSIPTGLQNFNDGAPIGPWVLNANAPSVFSLRTIQGSAGSAVNLPHAKVSDNHVGYWMRIFLGSSTQSVHDSVFHIGDPANSRISMQTGPLSSLNITLDPRTEAQDWVQILSNASQSYTFTDADRLTFRLYLLVNSPAGPIGPIGRPGLHAVYQTNSFTFTDAADTDARGECHWINDTAIGNFNAFLPSADYSYWSSLSDGDLVTGWIDDDNYCQVEITSRIDRDSATGEVSYEFAVLDLQGRVNGRAGQTIELRSAKPEAGVAGADGTNADETYVNEELKSIRKVRDITTTPDFTNFVFYSFSRSADGSSGVDLCDLDFHSLDDNGTDYTLIEADVTFQSNGYGRLDLDAIATQIFEYRTRTTDPVDDDRKIVARLKKRYAQIVGTVGYNPVPADLDVASGVIEVAYSDDLSHIAWTAFGTEGLPLAHADGATRESANTGIEAEYLIMGYFRFPDLTDNPQYRLGDINNYPTIDVDENGFDAGTSVWNPTRAVGGEDLTQDTLVGLLARDVGSNQRRYYLFANGSYEVVSGDLATHTAGGIRLESTNAYIGDIIISDALSANALADFNGNIVKSRYDDGLFGRISDVVDVDSSGQGDIGFSSVAFGLSKSVIDTGTPTAGQVRIQEFGGGAHTITFLRSDLTTEELEYLDGITDRTPFNVYNGDRSKRLNVLVTPTVHAPNSPLIGFTWINPAGILIEKGTPFTNGEFVSIDVGGTGLAGLTRDTHFNVANQTELNAIDTDGNTRIVFATIGNDFSNFNRHDLIFHNGTDWERIYRIWQEYSATGTGSWQRERNNDENWTRFVINGLPTTPFTLEISDFARALLSENESQEHNDVHLTFDHYTHWAEGMRWHSLPQGVTANSDGVITNNYDDLEITFEDVLPSNHYFLIQNHGGVQYTITETLLRFERLDADGNLEAAINVFEQEEDSIDMPANSSTTLRMETSSSPRSITLFEGEQGRFVVQVTGATEGKNEDIRIDGGTLRVNMDFDVEGGTYEVYIDEDFLVFKNNNVAPNHPDFEKQIINFREDRLFISAAPPRLFYYGDGQTDRRGPRFELNSNNKVTWDSFIEEDHFLGDVNVISFLTGTDIPAYVDGTAADNQILELADNTYDIEVKGIVDADNESSTEYRAYLKEALLTDFDIEAHGYEGLAFTGTRFITLQQGVSESLDFYSQHGAAVTAEDIDIDSVGDQWRACTYSPESNRVYAIALQNDDSSVEMQARAWELDGTRAATYDSGVISTDVTHPQGMAAVGSRIAILDATGQEGTIRVWTLHGADWFRLTSEDVTLPTLPAGEGYHDIVYAGDAGQGFWVVTNQRIRNVNHDGTVNTVADISLSGISNRPRGLEIDRDELLLFVLDDQNDQIRVFEESGGRRQATDEILDEHIFRINSSGFGTFALSLKSYDIDRTGQLYVELEGHSNQPDIGVNILIENLSRIGDD